MAIIWLTFFYQESSCRFLTAAPAQALLKDYKFFEDSKTIKFFQFRFLIHISHAYVSTFLVHFLEVKFSNNHSVPLFCSRKNSRDSLAVYSKFAFWTSKFKGVFYLNFSILLCLSLRYSFCRKFSFKLKKLKCKNSKWKRSNLNCVIIMKVMTSLLLDQRRRSQFQF